MRVLIIRFDAPLMSFGGVMVDQNGPTDRFPGISMLSGLFGNALGYTHFDSDSLQSLQERIEYAARWDHQPESIVDYHTADLGQAKMRKPGWTTRGVPEHREGGTAAKETHERYRHYWANGLMTLACALPGDASPSTDMLAAALRQPARPLFLGRKACLPASPLVVEVTDAKNVLSAIQNAKHVERGGTEPTLRVEACWPTRLGMSEGSHAVEVQDLRDWSNQMHKGHRTRVEGLLEILG